MLENELVQGRRIGSVEIAEIRALIEGNPLWSRYRLSQALAGQWQWYAASGQLKDMAARSLLLKLQERGLITLPPRRHAPVARRPAPLPDLFDSVPCEPIAANLSSLGPLEIQVVGRKQAGYQLLEHYLNQHHYLGYRGPVGESLAYLVRSAAGVDLGCVIFGAAAWQCAPRERWIGWSSEQRAQGLKSIANNSRFLVLPWVRSSGLANHILSQISRRITADWQSRYGHPIYGRPRTSPSCGA